MRHPLLLLAEKEKLHKDDFARSLSSTTVDKPKPGKKNNVKPPYKLGDAGGLFLYVLPKGKDGKLRRLWRYKYRIDGKEGLYAIGSYPEIGLADARQIHRAARWLVARGKHPSEYASEQRKHEIAEHARRKANTFAAVCEKWLALDAGKISDKSMKQRRREIEKDLTPELGEKPITGIRKDELAELLAKTQTRAPEVARNLRNYLAWIFDYAIDAGLVAGSPVPGSKILPKRDQQPHAALSIERAGDLLRAIEAASCDEKTRIAILLLMLTAVRKSELIEAKWNEFNLDKAEWHIPAERMKMRDPHWVPLSAQAVELLRKLQEISEGDILFPNVRDPHRPMATRSINALMGRLGFLEEAKPHGFRSTFSTYFNGAGWNPDVIEKCLAHKPKDAIRAKYNRADYRKDQRQLLQHWADTLSALQDGAKIVPIKKSAAKGK